jgi:site-specific DNA recombinase
MLTMPNATTRLSTLSRCAGNHSKGRGNRGYHAPRYLLSGLLRCGTCGSNFIMANADRYRCSSHTNGGQHCCSHKRTVARTVIEPILLRGLKQDLLSSAALAEVRKLVAQAQRNKKSMRSAAERELKQLDASIERVTDAIAVVGMSRALREKLAALETKRTEVKAQLRGADVAGAVDVLPRVVDGWRALVDDLEALGQHPHARPEEVDEARERLGRLIGPVQLLPEGDHLVATVGLDVHELVGRPYIGVVAGVGFEPTTFGL